jgi:hypothetical protein
MVNAVWALVVAYYMHGQLIGLRRTVLLARFRVGRDVDMEGVRWSSYRQIDLNGAGSVKHSFHNTILMWRSFG